MPRSKKSSVAGLFAVLALASIQPSVADTLKYGGAWFTPYDSSFDIHDGTPSALSVVGAAAGGFKMTDITGPTVPANTSFLAWCVDIYHHLNTSSSGDSYALRTGAQFYGTGSTKIQYLERLASYVVDNDGNSATTTVPSALTGNVQSAAFQLAVWEIVNEGTASTYDVYSGDFYVSGGDTVAKDLANTWLSNSHAWARTQTLSVWEGPDSTQDLAVFAPVPEPQSYLMLLAGITVVGFGFRRRRPKGSVRC